MTQRAAWILTLAGAASAPARTRMYLLYAASTAPMSLVTVALFLDSFRLTGGQP